MKTNLEILLGEWGRWRAKENAQSLGYPDAAAFTRLHVDGQRRADPEVFMADDDMRRLDDSITAMQADYRAVVASHYIGRGPVKVKAHVLGVSVRAYYVVLEHAHIQLSHAMGGKYATGHEPKLCTHLDGVCA